MKFDAEELNQLADAVSERVLERLRPLLTNKDKGHDGDKIFTVATLAEYLGMEKDWVYSHIKEIPHHKVGRFPRFRKREIDKWLEARRGPTMSSMPSFKAYKLHGRPLD